jgi:hypothetical protein
MVSIAEAVLLLLLILALIWRSLGARTAVCVLVLILLVLANFESGAMQAHYVCTRNGCDAASLADRGFDAISDKSGHMNVVTIVDNVPTLLFAALFLMLMGRDAILRDVALLSFAAGMFARAIIVAATGIPAAKEGNALVPLFEARLSTELRNMLGLSPPPAKNSSHFDLMFSGHEFCSVLGFLWLLHLANADHGAPLLLALLFAAAQGAGLIAIRIHYTADVLVGALLAALVFVVASRVTLPWARAREKSPAPNFSLPSMLRRE